MHAILDSDGDGKVSMSEGLTYVREQRKNVSYTSINLILADMDFNKDERVDMQEFEKDLPNWKMDEDEKEDAVQRFSKFDSDQDGLLDKTELPLFLYWLIDFRKADRNHDDGLTFKEFHRNAAKKSPQGVPGVKPEDKDVFKGLDVDGNKRLSLQEYVHYKTGTYAAEEALKKLFELADKDADMHISRRELVKSRESMGLSSAYYHLKDWAKHEGVLEKEEEKASEL